MLSEPTELNNERHKFTSVIAFGIYENESHKLISVNAFRTYGTETHKLSVSMLFHSKSHNLARLNAFRTTELKLINCPSQCFSIRRVITWPVSMLFQPTELRVIN